MKLAPLFIAAAALAAAAGCATPTPDDRIPAHQASFSTWPPEVQAKVRAGEVDVGFTPEQVLVALGEPSMRTQAAGPQGVTEVWVYRRRAARLSVGVGGASFGGHTAVGGAVSANGIRLGQDMSGRVVFANGRVADVMVTVR
jgi:hypothetical protein